MKKVIAVVILLYLITGCATTANYEKKLASWVGESELDLVRSWGPPQQIYETGGRKFLLYTNARSVFIPGTAPSYTTNIIGNTAYTHRVGGSPAQNINLSCQTIFELENERVVSWRWQGNSCKARD